MIINKNDLIALVSSRSGKTKKDTAAIINATLDVITDELIEENKVQFIGFGTLEVRRTKARKGINPQTGEHIDIPERKIAAFRTGAILKTRPNQ